MSGIFIINILINKKDQFFLDFQDISKASDWNALDTICKGFERWVYSDVAGVLFFMKHFVYNNRQEMSSGLFFLYHLDKISYNSFVRFIKDIDM